eukprot:TRINITY_DN26796_c0_g1_i1.p1 TRINITY_DN26796_c0_g1~~TRINITY_DN26796_c0_g1_i1.p1  ORF type:complete len:1079 (-),score=156.86 TRINITY_DN26796_c0_g1_i1:383-3568(-)
MEAGPSPCQARAPFGHPSRNSPRCDSPKRYTYASRTQTKESVASQATHPSGVQSVAFPMHCVSQEVPASSSYVGPSKALQSTRLGMTSSPPPATRHPTGVVVASSTTLPISQTVHGKLNSFTQACFHTEIRGGDSVCAPRRQTSPPRSLMHTVRHNASVHDGPTAAGVREMQWRHQSVQGGPTHAQSQNPPVARIQQQQQPSRPVHHSPTHRPQEPLPPRPSVGCCGTSGVTISGSCSASSAGEGGRCRGFSGPGCGCNSRSAGCGGYPMASFVTFADRGPVGIASAPSQCYGRNVGLSAPMQRSVMVDPQVHVSTVQDMWAQSQRSSNRGSFNGRPSSGEAPLRTCRPSNNGGGEVMAKSIIRSFSSGGLKAPAPNRGHRLVSGGVAPKLNSGNDVMEAVVGFLSKDHGGVRGTAQALVKAASANTGVSAYYYSSHTVDLSSPKSTDFCLEGAAGNEDGPCVLGTPPQMNFSSAVCLAAVNRGVRSSVDVSLPVAEAVLTPEGVCVGVLLIAATSGVQRLEAGDARLVQVTARMWASVLGERLERLRVQQMLAEQRQVIAIHDVATELTQAETTAEIPSILQERSGLKDTFFCEAATIFFYDHLQNELWTPPTEGLPNGMSLPFGKGIVGHVAEIARDTGNFQMAAMIVNNPRICPFWIGETNPNFVTRNMMTGPILSERDGQLLGAVQVLNKHQDFTPEDMKLMEQFARSVGMHLDRLLPDRVFTKIGLPDPSEKVRQSVSTLDVEDWRVDYWGMSEADELCAFMRTLDNFDVLSHIPVSRDVLASYFAKVKDGYMTVPYHSFHHAVSTIHYSYKLLTATGVANVFSPADVFSLQVCALIHDVGHRGYNNAFEVCSRSELALRYNDKSPLENFSCARAFEIAKTWKGEGDCNIFANFDTELYKEVRRLLVTCTLSTDMAAHGTHVENAKGLTLPLTDDATNKLNMLELVLHCADIGNVAMPHEVSRRWALQLAEEFTRQVEAERCSGLPVSAMMDGLGSHLARAKANQGFMNFLCAPLLNPLFLVLPGWASPKEFFTFNLKAWTDDIAAAAKEAEAEQN